MTEPAPITRDDVAHVAKLARLDLTESELDTYTGQLASILGHARDIAALDLHALEPTDHPYGLRNALREDVVTASIDRDELLAAAPSVAEGRFRVGRILGEAP